MNRLVSLALLAGLAACAPMQWVKPDAGPEQVARDADICRMEAMQEAMYRSWMWPGPLAPTIVRDAQGRRFVLWPAPDPFHDRFMLESRLAHFCMRAKGYDLQAVEPKR